MIHAYIRLSDLKYPFLEGNLRLLFPHIQEHETDETFPHIDGYAGVEDTYPPEYDQANFKIVEDAPQIIDGVWKRVWKTVELNAAEKIIAEKGILYDTDTLLRVDVRKASLIVKDMTGWKKDYLEGFIADAEAFMNEYPRTRTRPIFQLPSQDPDSRSIPNG